VSGRLGWLLAEVRELRPETPEVRTIGLTAPDWPGHLAGQHLDLKLTAEDGYTAQRSYSLASQAGVPGALEITVERVDGGEVSPFLLDELRVGDTLELRGPIGGYFTWSPESPGPLMLVGGGSGIVPLMAMLRTRADAAQRPPARLLHSSRSAEHIIYRNELDELAGRGDGFTVTHTLTRLVPDGWNGERGRIDAAMLARHGFAPAERPGIFVCGPTPFVEAAANVLLAMGHSESMIRTERFGPSGDSA
jgi:ferredoxin-NADP reductase